MWKGSCLCGEIRYEIDALDTGIEHCHCQTCRKAHAAAFNSSAGVLPEHFRWLKGEDLLAGYESSPGKIRHFCGRCGSHLVAIIEGYPYWLVRIATLDEDPGVVPEGHIWLSHSAPWLAYEGDMAHHPEDSE